MISPDRGYEILQWDSGVFGFPVARIAGTENRNAIHAALDNARRSGVRLVYLAAESDELARIAQSLNGTPISERVTFAREVTADEGHFVQAHAKASPIVERWQGTTPTAELLYLAREAGRYSRFKVDPRVPNGVFEQIYDAWIANSLNKQIADEVMIIRDGSSLSGLVTVGSKDGRADIGLLAVREEARGRGLGKALVQASLEWARQRQFRVAQVVTQGANHPACQLYTSCGYNVERVEQVFHLWL